MLFSVHSRISCYSLSLTLAVLLPACAIAPRDQSLDAYVPTPETWRAESDDGSLHDDWLRDFAGEPLTDLVTEALNGNFDLRVAASRMRSFEAQRKSVNAARWPQLSAAFEAARSQQELAGVTSKGNDFSLQANISWELDLWQRLGNRTRAAVLDVEAARADYAAARLSLAANIARSWYDAITARRQVLFAEATERSFAETLEVIEGRYRNGIGDALDVRLARANLESARSRLEARRVQADNTVLLLETLLGRYPARELHVLESMPELAAVPPAGLPAQLVERRPDLLSARLSMLAETERQYAANKNYLPSLNLAGSYGSTTDDIDELLDFDDLVWRVAAQLTAPLFQAGRLEAERELAAATQEQAVLNYASTALDAFREVESALRAERYLEQQEDALKLAADESVQAEALAQERYAAGLADITTLLETQRRAVDAQSGLIDLRNQRLQNRINLHAALGGDFGAGERIDPAAADKETQAP